MTLPSIGLMIIGAQKSGTSSLHQYLAQHPGICTHTQREITYFINDDEFTQGYEKSFKRYFSSQWTGQKVLLGKSVGIMYLPRAIARLKTHNPSIQLVVFLRHPVQRAYSAYWYARRMGWEDIDDFETAINAPPSRFGSDWVRERNCAYLERSRYAEHLTIVLSNFPREKVHVFLLEDLKENVQVVCKQVLECANLESNIIIDTQRNHNAAAIARSPMFARILSKRSLLKRFLTSLLPSRVANWAYTTARRLNEKEFKPPSISPIMHNRLVEYFKPYNQELSILLDRDLTHWDATLT